ncbi:hypothetical protein HYU13_01010 [Candidatus Woesearchaeota archaeon]|nr:hypothetical protein [Candidatus Woesearchaeota archaeon]
MLPTVSSFGALLELSGCYSEYPKTLKNSSAIFTPAPMRINSLVPSWHDES